jgi:hypothetical protein
LKKGKLIGSYIEDALTSKEKVSEILMDKSVTLEPDEEWHEEFELKKGDIITITLTGNSVFFAGFCKREEYVKRYEDRFNFELFSDKKAYTGQIKISKNDDDYLELRKSMWHVDPVKIRVKVKCDRNE